MKSLLQRLSDAVPLLVLAGILSAGFFYAPTDLPNETLCLFKRYFILDCPGCGLTRAFLLIPRGQFFQALHFNFASVALYLLFLFAFIHLLSQRLQTKRRIDIPSKFKFILVNAVVMLLFGHWLYKMAGYFQTHSFGEYVTNLQATPIRHAQWFRILFL